MERITILIRTKKSDGEGGCGSCCGTGGTLYHKSECRTSLTDLAKFSVTTGR